MNLKLNEQVAVPAFRLLGLPASVVTLIERRANDWYVVRYPNGETPSVHASDFACV